MTGQNQADPIFGEIIHRYTRAQAIADGVLVDVSATARMMGFGTSVALTRAAFEDCVAWHDGDTERQVPQTETIRLFEVLSAVLIAAPRKPRSWRGRTDTMVQLNRVPRDGKTTRSEPIRLNVIYGPGDNSSPVITIMLPGED